MDKQHKPDINAYMVAILSNPSWVSYHTSDSYSQRYLAKAVKELYDDLSEQFELNKDDVQ